MRMPAGACCSAPLRLKDGEHLASALPGCTHLLIRNGFHSDFFIA